jgi:2-keto-4-pentenoate hydratase/2-oxohepta-3-ene-1,7-dioic acid hydratase in catechol pathway
VGYEGELAVVLGRTTRDISPDQALSAVAGYTVANDVSARVWQQQKGGSQWNRGKSFDTFCPLGPWLVTADTGLDPTDLRVRTRLNGQLMQDGHTRDLLFPVAELIAFLSQGTTLLSGTVLLTGTPEGVGWARTPRVTLHAGDVVDVEIPGIGCLRSPVRSWR